jgi:outer membrane protein assembly factor BamB
MKRLSLCLMTVLMALALSGCNPLGKDNNIPPSPLMKFKQTVSVQRLWTASVGNGDGGYYLRLVPAAANNTVFAVSHNGNVMAYAANTGRLRWGTSLRQSITSGVVAGDGNVYVGTGAARLVALSQKTGKIMWSRTLTGEVLAQPQYAKGIVLVHTVAGTLAAFSADDGHRLWRFDQHVPSLILHAAGQPQVAGNYAVAGFANGQLSALGLTTGRVVWDQHITIPMGDNPVARMVDITVNPVIVDGVVYVTTYQGRVAALNLGDGRMIWQHKLSSYAGMTADRSRLYIADAKSELWAFNEASGAVAWRQTRLRGRQITAPVIYKNMLVTADRYGYLHFMSLSDGHFLARVSMGRGALAAPVSYRGNLYIYTSAGKLLAVRGR